MKILVCVKAVNSMLIQKNEASEISRLTLNPYDTYSLLRAIELKNQNPESKITCLCMGPEAAKEVLTRCLAMGADDAILVTDVAFAGADTYATTLTLVKAIETIPYDLIFCGKCSVDGETGQVAGGLAARLGICCFTEVERVNVEKDSLCVTYADDEVYRTVLVSYPLVLSFSDFCVQSIVNLFALKKAKKKQIHILRIEDLAVKSEECGSSGSKTMVCKTSSNIKASQREVKFIDENIEAFLIAQIKKNW
ncbi:electron transfer flavoprotein subunit beta/FixA family protein [Hungatella hathewayi]|uniref:electron transfer flavoprotein subunit beta/FixA family protein n=1 Tax=Hungatella hathewayi TaxID=154046 RepID=UPI00356A8140